MKYTNLVKTIWDAIYDPKEKVIEAIDTYFHKDYEQCINGIIMNRDEYIHHAYNTWKTYYE